MLCRCHVCPVGRSIVLWCCGVSGVSQPPKVVASRRVVSVEVDPVNRGVLGLWCRNRRGVVVSVEGCGPGVPGVVGGVGVVIGLSRCSERGFCGVTKEEVTKTHERGAHQALGVDVGGVVLRRQLGELDGGAGHSPAEQAVSDGHPT